MMVNRSCQSSQSSAEVQDRRWSWFSEDKDNSDWRDVNFITLSTFNWALTSVLYCLTTDWIQDVNPDVSLPWWQWSLKPRVKIFLLLPSPGRFSPVSVGRLVLRFCWFVLVSSWEVVQSLSELSLMYWSSDGLITLINLIHFLWRVLESFRHNVSLRKVIFTFHWPSDLM